MRRFIRVFVTATVFTLTAFAAPARADGVGALAALKINVARAHATLPFESAGIELAPSLVKGLYVYVDKRNPALRWFVNEGGTVIGTRAGWKKVLPALADFSTAERADMRAEILDNIDFDKLIKLQYGDGGERRMLLFSAVDCPHCQYFEQSLRRAAPALNTTFYVLPLSLLGDDTAEGKQNWQTAANIWCAHDNAGAWRAYWANPFPLSGQRCAAPPPQPRNAYRTLTALLASIGIAVNATPAIVREDGTLLFPQDSFAVKYAQDNFNPSVFGAMTIEAANKGRRWLR